MIKEALYLKTEEILFQAYFNDTLKHGQCTACAVGNIVAANCGYKLVKKTVKVLTEVSAFLWKDTNDGRVLPKWDNVFYTAAGIQNCTPDDYRGFAKIEIDSTGYIWQELAQFEYAFETAPKGTSEEDHMFNGLIAVLEVLKKIHQVEEGTHINTKAKFQKHFANKVLEKGL